MTGAVELLEHTIAEAHRMSASDIHINPGERETRVLVRVDGMLREQCRVSSALHAELVSRIKVLSFLRLDEHNAAQDGRFRLTLQEGAPIDVRTSVIPTYHGERAVLRLLCGNARSYTLEGLGFSEADVQKITPALKRKSGMILATGPTGSGKTTTLYTFLSMIKGEEVSVVTIEDPIEYAIAGVTQIPVQPSRGLTFGSGLRSVLRQDPDIIMVGEIRDAETAGIAVNTALTGHLLLSSLHTTSAATTLPRLLDMGVDAYLVASTVEMAIGQRLVRRVCEACKREREPLAAEKKFLGAEVGSVFEGSGCSACEGTGYRGRVSLNEVLVVDADLRDAIAKKQSAAQLQELAVAKGMTTMLKDGARKVEAGITTVAEVLASIHENKR